VGLCFEAAAFPPDVMAVGELHELDGGYSIKAAEADVDTGKAVFLLYKEGRVTGTAYSASVSSGERFNLNDGENFHFEATLDSVFRSDDTTMVHLTEYDWWGEPEPESVYDWPEWEAESWVEREPEIPTPKPEPEAPLTPEPTEEPDFSLLYLIIVLVCCIAIGLPLIFIIYRNGKRPSGGQNQQKLVGPEDNAQKIEEYRAKMEEWEKGGYDVSELKEVLEEKK